MPTKTVATFANGLVEFQIDYDAAECITAVRCVNATDSEASCRIYHLTAGRSATLTIPAQTTRSVSVPTNAAARLQTHIDERGHLVDIGMEFLG